MSYAFLRCCMNENAKRRQDLVLQMKKGNHISSTVPAIHPRYDRIYHDLYDQKKESTMPKYSFSFRLFVAVLCFLLYLAVNTSNVEMAQKYSSRITSTIQKNYDYKEMQEIPNILKSF